MRSGTPLLRALAPSTSRELVLRLCGACGAAVSDPWPTRQEVEALYSDDYTYYRPANEDPGAEASSLKYRVAGLRYRRLTNAGATAWISESIARVAELLTRKSVTFSLGIPLSMPRTAAMLDYGCGTGFWLRSMRRKGFSALFGFDIASNRAVGERLAAEGVEVLTEAQLESRPGYFDLVRLEQVFEHLQDPIGVLERLRRLMSPSGRLVMTFPSIEPWIGFRDLERSRERDHLQFPMHLVQHSRTTAVEWLSAGGFEIAGLRVTSGERFLTVAASPISPEGRSA